MAHTQEQLEEAIASIAGINPSVAADLTTLYIRTTTFLGTFEDLEQLFTSLTPEERLTSQELVDLNDAARTQAADMFGVLGNALSVYGGIRFASALLAEGIAVITADKIATAVATTAFKEFLQATWDEVSLSLLPPLVQGTNDEDIILGDLDGGVAELLGGNDIFVANDVTAPYWVRGGSGDDVIFGGRTGSDSLDGGIGNDTIIANHGAFDISGGDGNDWLQTEATIALSLKGNNGSDTLIGSSDDDDVFGTDIPLSDEAILAASPSDSDYLIGRGGNDSINGSIGNDFLIGDNFSDSNSPEEQAAFATFIANVAGKISASGVAGNDTMIGYDGDDVIAGGGGNDSIYGDDSDANNITDGNGNDTLFGDAGNDTIFGGGGIDAIDGGDGDDHVIFDTDDFGTQVIEGGDGDDHIESTSTRAGIYLGGNNVAAGIYDADGHFTFEIAAGYGAGANPLATDLISYSALGGTRLNGYAEIGNIRYRATLANADMDADGAEDDWGAEIAALVARNSVYMNAMMGERV